MAISQIQNPFLLPYAHIFFFTLILRDSLLGVSFFLIVLLNGRNSKCFVKFSPSALCQKYQTHGYIILKKTKLKDTKCQPYQFHKSNILPISLSTKSLNKQDVLASLAPFPKEQSLVVSNLHHCLHLLLLAFKASTISLLPGPLLSFYESQIFSFSLIVHLADFLLSLLHTALLA